MRSIQRNILDARRWLCLFLVCAFILCGIGGIHQRAKAIVGVDDALIGIIVAGLAAIGITFVSTGAYHTLSDYVGSLLEDYADSLGFTPAGLFAGTQSGANNIGQLLINNRFVTLISGFASYLISRFGLTNGGTVTAVTPATTLGGLVSYALPLRIYSNSSSIQDREWVEVSASAPMYAILGVSGSTLTVNVWSTEPGQYQIVKYRHNGSAQQGVLGPYTLSETASGVYKANYNGLDTSYFPTSQYTTYSTSEVSGVFADPDTTPQDTTVGIDIQVGTIVLPADDPNYSTGDGAAIDLSAPWGSTYPDIVDRWIPREWAPGDAGTPEITYDDAPAITDQVVTGPETASVSEDPGDYAVPGLQSVFPFCLPFDIYNLLSALAADPVAPAFTWRFYVPGICDESISIDLSPFDSVAQIVRTVELLAFIVGLALVTRERFLRG